MEITKFRVIGQTDCTTDAKIPCFNKSGIPLFQGCSFYLWNFLSRPCLALVFIFPPTTRPLNSWLQHTPQMHSITQKQHSSVCISVLRFVISPKPIVMMSKEESNIHATLSTPISCTIPSVKLLRLRLETWIGVAWCFSNQGPLNPNLATIFLSQ